MASKEFELMRVAMVSLARSHPDAMRQSDAYAWAARIYPALYGSDTAKPFKDEFEVGEEAVLAVLNHMADQDDAGVALTFYDLENHFGGKYGDGQSRHPTVTLDRTDLIRIVRYFALDGRFGPSFWSTLLANGRAPAEALSLSRDFEPGDLTLY